MAHCFAMKILIPPRRSTRHAMRVVIARSAGVPSVILSRQSECDGVPKDLAPRIFSRRDLTAPRPLICGRGKGEGSVFLYSCQNW
jgi:nitrogen-specific signal transduction histidine kinase